MKAGEDEEQKGLLGLLEGETELDNLTEFNTAHNKRISNLAIEESDMDIQGPTRRRRRSSHVSFSGDEEIINLEDVDSSAGCFRNLSQATVVPVKKNKNEGSGSLGLEDTVHRMQNLPISGGLDGDLPPTSHEVVTPHMAAQEGPPIQGALPHMVPNLAPEVDQTPTSAQPPITLNTTPASGTHAAEPLNEPCKKKYTKEVWPGKKPTPSLLI